MPKIITNQVFQAGFVFGVLLTSIFWIGVYLIAN